MRGGEGAYAVCVATVYLVMVTYAEVVLVVVTALGGCELCAIERHGEGVQRTVGRCRRGRSCRTRRGRRRQGARRRRWP